MTNTVHLIDTSGNTLPCGYRPVVGVSSSSSTEINEVTCADCIAIHDSIVDDAMENYDDDPNPYAGPGGLLDEMRQAERLIR